MNKCTTKTTVAVDENGNPKEKRKKAFFTLESAIVHAKEMNAREDRTEKVVAYKCSTCHRYHVGRNGNTIKDKEKDKIRKSLDKPKQFKVLGFIDLNNVRKK
jgi:hypothetical protein